jgi:hypothetical protein
VPLAMPRNMIMPLDELLEEQCAEQPEVTQQGILREAVAHYLAVARRKAK